MIKVGKKGDTRILAAEWVDEELKDNIKKRKTQQKMENSKKKRRTPRNTRSI